MENNRSIFQKIGIKIRQSTYEQLPDEGVSITCQTENSLFIWQSWKRWKLLILQVVTEYPHLPIWYFFRSFKSASGAKQGKVEELSFNPFYHLPSTAFINLVDHRALTETALTKDGRFEQVWFHDQEEHVILSLRHKSEALFRQRSNFQLVEILDTYEYGRMLALDRVIMCTEADEFVYHEMIAHVPMTVAPQTIKRVLVIGGGDGGTVRELLKHEQLKEVVLVEIDSIVIKACQQHLPKIASSFYDARLQVVIGDGIQYVKKAPAERFDLVIIDSNDPVGPSQGLFSVPFYQDVARILSPEGILITQSGSPRCQVKNFQDCFASQRFIFGKDRVFCYLFYMPSYTSGMWSFSFATKGTFHPVEDLDKTYAEDFTDSHKLRYYSPAVHRGAFALPGFVEEKLREG